MQEIAGADKQYEGKATSRCERRICSGSTVSDIGGLICSYPVHGDRLEFLEGEVPGRFGAVPPFRLHKLEQGVSGHIL